MVLANATYERQGDHDKRVLISRKSQAYTVGGHSAQDKKLNFQHVNSIVREIKISTDK